MSKYNKRPPQIEAIRYGVQATGIWYPNAVADLEAWMIQNGGVAPLTQQGPGWNPPTVTTLSIRSTIDGWTPIALGDWAIVAIPGAFYAMTDATMKREYEPVAGP